jgi:hypothetical protein
MKQMFFVNRVGIIMGKNCKKLFRLFLVCALALSAIPSWAAQKKVALLVGVGDYTALSKLEGPLHDVQALQKVLVERWGYAASDVRALIDKAATRNAIVSELQGLMQRTQPGDEVFLYLSGHGTSSLQQSSDVALPDGSGAFYAVDSTSTGANLLIGRTDIRPVLEQLDKGGRKVWFVADTCFSGALARNMASHSSVALERKTVPLVSDKAYLSVLSDVRQNLEKQKDQAEWPYENVVFLSASASGEVAMDINTAGLSVFPTVDGKPHAAMTDALLRVLDGSLPGDVNRDGVLSLQEIYETVSLFMSSRPYGQMPQRLPAFKDDPRGVTRAPLLRGAAVRAPQSVYEPDPVKVHTLPCFDRGALSALEQLSRVPGVAMVDKLDASTRASLSTSLDKRQLLLLSPDGATIAAAPLTRVADMEGSLYQLVWLSKMEALAKSGRRAVLEAEITPAELGVTRLVGDKLILAVRPDRDAYLLIVNVNGLGEVSVVYPSEKHELSPLPGAVVSQLFRFTVELPEGTDTQLWFAFDQLPPALENQIERFKMKPGDAGLSELERLIGNEKGRYAFARTEFRTYTPESLKRPIAAQVCKP